MTAEVILLLKHEVDNNTGTSNQISNTRRCLDIRWFCKSAGFDDCKGNFMLLIHEIENNTGASHRISNWASVAYSMTCESVEFD